MINRYLNSTFSCKKSIFTVLVVVLWSQFSLINAQLSIEMCQEKARANYPMVHQYELIEQSEKYNLANANKGYLPQVSFSAKASYQSDVTEIPIKLPGINFEPLSKDQYQTSIEISQTIWDGGVIRSQKNISKAISETEKLKFETDMYALKDRVNQLFFGILLLDEQIRLNKILQDELQNNYNRIEASLKNGVANQSDINVIKVEQLKVSQRKIELLAVEKSFKQMLAAMIGEPSGDSMQLIKPDMSNYMLDVQEIKRPELNLFDAQNQMFDQQKKTIYAASMPKLGLFFQGGYGKPGLNMLNNEFSPFYIGGVRLTWNFGTLYTQRNNIAKIDLNKKTVDIQKETFIFNTQLAMKQQNNEIQKISELIKTDNEIIVLRKSIKEAAQIKLDNGTFTTTDLIREINAENSAVQEKILHEIQLLISINNLKNTTNN